MPSFKYIISLDVEATCWGEGFSNMGNPLRNKIEIIELGAVLLNTQTKKIESEFHRYVRPIKNPILSDYCKDLTGITQSLINAQETFPVVYSAFRTWLVELISERGLTFGSCSSVFNTAFCSWTSFDFKDFLARDFQYHCIPMPPEMKRWIDLKHQFAQETGIDRRYLKLRGALQTVGLDWSGAEHTALNDAKNLARLALGMIAKGHSINKTTDGIH